MLFTEYNEEEAKKVFMEDGELKGKVEAYQNMLKEGISKEVALKCVELPEQKVNEYLKEQARFAVQES